MGYNIPSYDETRMSIGPGILYLAAYSSGVSPASANDIGAVQDSTLRIARTKLDVFQGSPRTKVTAFAQQEEVTLECMGIEWNFQTMARALGAGTATAMNVAQPSFEFGDTVTFSNVSVWFRHQMPGGSYMHCYIWKANGSGEMEVTFGEGNDLHQFPYSFSALEESTDWAGTTLTAGKKLYKMIKSVDA